MAWSWSGGPIDSRPAPPKVGHPRRNRAAVKAGRKAARRNR